MFLTMCSSDSAFEIWNKLLVTYEGIDQVNDTKMFMLVKAYEMFTMEPKEMLGDMHKRLNDITTPLQQFGKIYTNVEVVGKILWSLPSSWISTVEAIREGGSIKTTSVDELFGKILNYEMRDKE